MQGATSAQPVPGPTPVANGSIFQSAQPINYGYQPLFEDRRPRNIGDTLTIVLQENVSASKSSSANASRDGKTNFGFDTVPRYLQGLFGNARADVEASGGNTFNGKGGANASNTFSGTLTVTVDQVLVNGNLHVVGEKQIAINQGTEFIRFSGVVNPRTISSPVPIWTSACTLHPETINGQAFRLIDEIRAPVDRAKSPVCINAWAAQ